MIINIIPNRKLINYSLCEQVKDIMPALIMSLVMGIIVQSINLLNFSKIGILFVQVIIGGGVYIIFSYMFKVESFMYLLDIVKNLGGKKHR